MGVSDVRVEYTLAWDTAGNLYIPSVVNSQAVPFWGGSVDPGRAGKELTMRSAVPSLVVRPGRADHEIGRAIAIQVLASGDEHAEAIGGLAAKHDLRRILQAARAEAPLPAEQHPCGLELVDEQLQRLVPVHQPPSCSSLDLSARVAGGADQEGTVQRRWYRVAMMSARGS